MTIQEMRLWLEYIPRRKGNPDLVWDVCPADSSTVKDFELLLEQAAVLTFDNEDQIACAEELERIHPGLPHDIYIYACHVVTGEYWRF